MFAKNNVLEGVGEWEVEVKCKMAVRCRGSGRE